MLADEVLGCVAVLFCFFVGGFLIWAGITGNLGSPDDTVPVHRIDKYTAYVGSETPGRHIHEVCSSIKRLSVDSTRYGQEGVYVVCNVPVHVKAAEEKEYDERH